MVKPSRFVERISPYKITPQDVWAATSPDNLLKLDWNESPVDFPWYQEELRRISFQDGLIAWYPDCLAIELTENLSHFVGINCNLILTFPGSDVGLETLCRAYLDSHNSVLFLSPNYENFRVYVAQTGASVRDFVVIPPDMPHVSSIIDLVRSATDIKAIYLSRPNNPLGYVIPSDLIKELALSLSETLVIVDEAYIEFSDQDSCASLVENLPNLVVSRTFSKAFGMAGMRLGYICSSVEIINTLNKIRNGKNVSMISQRLGIVALQNFSLVSDWISEVRRSRIYFESWCTSRGIAFFPSQGNFVLFRVDQPAELCSHLKSSSIYIRNRDLVGPGLVRATIGNQSHVQRLIQALDDSQYVR